MAKSQHSFLKRKKELERKKKQEEKLKKRLEKKHKKSSGEEGTGENDAAAND